jgi:hypothetical protein
MCAMSSSDQPIDRAAVIAPSNARCPWMYSNDAANRFARIFSERVGIRAAEYVVRRGLGVGDVAGAPTTAPGRVAGAHLRDARASPRILTRFVWAAA